MARLYPPVTEEVLSAFCLSYDDANQKKTGAVININFNLNRAVANAEITGIALRLRTISTNKYVITENIKANSTTGKSEGIALSYDLEEGICTFSITAKQNPDVIEILKVGQFYKAQLAFIDLNGDIGYWSTVATIKCVARPSVTIANYDPNDANIFVNEIIGEYVQDTQTGDSSEKVYSYRFQLFDKQNNLLDDTGIQLHNSSYDISSNSSTDEYYCYQELNDGEAYYLVYSVTTINGLSISSARYQVITAESVDPEEDITLVVSNGLEENSNSLDPWYPWEEGLIKIYPDLNGENKRITGNFVVLRASSKDNFHMWQEVKRFRLSNEVPSSKVFYDYTVEQGISYRYAIQQFNRQQFYSRKVYSYKRNVNDGSILLENGSPIYNDVTADFEDMFLYDGTRQLKIRFNPKVSSFKNDLQEQKIDTIGSKHPFIFRNGNVCYKEFPISGLISFQLDNAQFFITDEDYKQMKLERFEPDNKVRDNNSYITYVRVLGSELNDAINNNIQLYQYAKEAKSTFEVTGHESNIKNNSSNQVIIQSYYKEIDSAQNALLLAANGIAIYKKVENIAQIKQGKITRENIDYYKPNVYNKTDLTSENIMSERYFKLSVLDWLTDGKPKLFRSPTEGNYIVRLLNVNLTPKTELGRMIHEFTCTAYEVADFNYESLRDFGLLKIQDPNEIEKSWFSKDISSLFNEENKGNDGYYVINTENKEIVGFQCTGFAPGDKIQITIKDTAIPLEITIGATGTYIYDEGKSIINIAVLPINNTGDFSRNILLASEGYSYQRFDTIASISTHTWMGDQIVGPVNNYLQTNTVGIGNTYYTSPNVNLIEGEGEKLKISEILHLHARRREIIPIFYIGNGDDISSTPAQTMTKPVFALTPFGQGYIRSKSIVPKSLINWLNDYGNLEEEELKKARTVKDLVDFVINKCNYDIFCLFEVYAPKTVDNSTTWERYSTLGYRGSNWGDLTWGIYDPILYEKQTKIMPLTDQKIYANQMGWWPTEPRIVDGSTYKLNTSTSAYTDYDPTLVFHYGEKEVVISLEKEPEVILENIAVPDYISIGNGVILEPIFRLQCIDYTIENENNTLKNLKNIYLAAKQTADKNILTYRNSVRQAEIGKILTKKYSEQMSILQDQENYKAVVKMLTEAARKQQIEKLMEYFKSEKGLINLVLSQLKLVDADLKEQIGSAYIKDPSIQIYPSNENGIVNKGVKSYNEFFENEDKFSELDEPILMTVDESSSLQEYQNEIEAFIQHIQNSNEYNFSDIITRIIDQLQPAVDFNDRQLEELQNRVYVSQYLELLNQQGINALFSDTVYKDENNEYPAYKLVCKSQAGIENLQNLLITNSQWKEYFHLDGLPLLVLKNAADSQTYEVEDLDFYFGEEPQVYVGSDYPSLIVSLGLTGENSSSIASWLDTVNSAVNSDNNQTKAELQQKYNETYEPITIADGAMDWENLKVTLKLGDLNSDYTINKINHQLELIIDNLYLTNSDISANEILEDIQGRSIYTSLPKSLQILINSYIIDYLTVPEGGTESPRSIYEQICACAAYRDSHEDNLIDDQKIIVKTTITNLKNMPEYYNFITKYTEPGSEYNINEYIETWEEKYNNVKDDTNTAYENALKKLTELINQFNNIIQAKNSAIDTFNNYRRKYQAILQDYSVSDNIKDILWEEREIYNNAINELKQIKILFNQQLNSYQQDVLLEGYLQFLQSYIETNANSNSNNRQALLQLLQEAQNMANAVVNEDYSPEKQKAIVDKAWKEFLDALASIYQTEVKERFG